MAEAAFRQMIATFVQQTRPQSFRLGKPFRYPQRCFTNAPTPQANEHAEQQPAKWQSKSLPPHASRSPQGARLSELRDDPEPRSFSSFLTDNYAREHNYLRISVTERCNLRCLYCMPEEGVPLSPPDHILTTPEIVYLSSLFVSQGVDKIRLTGGEPTVRKDIVDLMHQIGKLRKDGLKELCLTTNGISLHRKLDSMVEAGLTGINLSLDTLDQFQFVLMTRRNGHEAVMKSIRRILEMNRLGAGIKLKINCVVMRGVNEREILPFVEMGQQQDLEVRFIEYMPFDGNKWSKNKMLSFEEMLVMIQEKYPNIQKVQGHANDTSKTYQIPGFQGRIGFITSMTHNFCGTCNRLRITSDGSLKVCLFGNSEVSLRDILREANNGRPIDAEAMDAIKQIEIGRQGLSPTTSDQYSRFSDREIRLLEVIGMAVKRKKPRHAGMGELENMKNRPMILIDGHEFTSNTSHSLPTSSPIQHQSHLGFEASHRSRRAPLNLLLASSMNFDALTVSGTRFGTQRALSTENRYIRKVASQSTFRRIPAPNSDPTGPAGEALTSKITDHELHPDDDFQADSAIEEIPGQPFKHPASASRHRSQEDFSKHSLPLTHLDSHGEARMVDISDKAVSNRSATAEAVLHFSNEQTYTSLISSTLEKGDALAVARIAAIQAAKKTADLIPLAHPGLGLTGIQVSLKPFKPYSKQLQGEEKRIHFGGVRATSTVSCGGKTGVEMEALTSATVAALTIYDMLKAIDKAMTIKSARVIAKRGGKSGDWKYDPQSRQIKRLNGASKVTNSQNQHLIPGHLVLTKPNTATENKEIDQVLLKETEQLLGEKNRTESELQQAANIDENHANNYGPSPNTTQTESLDKTVDGQARQRQDKTPPEPNNQDQNTHERTPPESGQVSNTHTPISPFINPSSLSLNRDTMSGNFPNRASSADFYSRRMERYVDWISKR